jgi:hypothetical protein
MKRAIMSRALLSSLVLAVVVFLICETGKTDGFVTSPIPISTLSSALKVDGKQSARRRAICLDAKTKPGKGFGKETPSVPQKESIKRDGAATGVGLTSVPGGSSNVPVMEQQQQGSSQSAVDESLPSEVRISNILRDKYGLRTREEQQAELLRQQKAAEESRKLKEWKELAAQGKDFDLIEILPAPLLIFIDRFLKAGVAVCTTLFVSAGLAITVEAGSKATNKPLPENVDAFITNVVEPNFTPGLLVLLGFSISLGAFAALQLGSSSSTYREDS